LIIISSLPQTVKRERGPTAQLNHCARIQAAVRKEVADAIIKAVVAVKSAEITADKVVVRFGEAVDGFPLPAGHTHENVHLPPKDK
jgi:hypothetical protein